MPSSQGLVNPTAPHAAAQAVATAQQGSQNLIKHHSTHIHPTWWNQSKLSTQIQTQQQGIPIQPIPSHPPVQHHFMFPQQWHFVMNSNLQFRKITGQQTYGHTIQTAAPSHSDQTAALPLNRTPLPPNLQWMYQTPTPSPNMSYSGSIAPPPPPTQTVPPCINNTLNIDTTLTLMENSQPLISSMPTLSLQTFPPL